MTERDTGAEDMMRITQDDIHPDDDDNNNNKDDKNVDNESDY